MIKYYPIKTNGEIRKTPITSDSLVGLHKEIKSYYGINLVANESDHLNNSYAVIDGKNIYWKELLLILKGAVEDHNRKRQEEINSLYNERMSLLKKEVDEKLSNEEKVLFWLLYNNLEIKVYPNGYVSNSDYFPTSLTFKGIDLSKITVLKSEVPKLIEF